MSRKNFFDRMNILCPRNGKNRQKEILSDRVYCYMENIMYKENQIYSFLYFYIHIYLYIHITALSTKVVLIVRLVKFTQKCHIYAKECHNMFYVLPMNATTYFFFFKFVWYLFMHVCDYVT